MTCHVCVVVHTPAHSQVSGPLTYGSVQPLAPGTLVRVPLGKRETLGVVWDTDPHAPPPPDSMDVKPVASVLDALAPLPAAWRELVAFSARYYQRSLGEVALAALPPQLRDLGVEQLARRLKRAKDTAPTTSNTTDLIALSAEQQSAIGQFGTKNGHFLLFGAAGGVSFTRLRRRASCSTPRSRSCGGNAAKATSPNDRW